MDIDDLLDSISNQRRRAIIVLLEDGPMTKIEIAEEISRMKYGVGYNSNERKRELVGIYQNHLPKLVDNNIIRKSQQNRDSYEKAENYDICLLAIEKINELTVSEFYNKVIG